jgi:hypothetical protein
MHRTIAASAAGQMIDAAPKWVTIVALGATLLFAAYLGPAAAFALGASGAFRINPFAGPVALSVIALLHANGVWLVTAGEPGRSPDGRPWQRVVTVILRLVATAPVVAMTYFLHTMWRRGWEDDRALIVTMSALMACPALTMIRLQYLTRRLGRPRVAEHAFLAGFDLSLTLIIAATLATVSHRSEWFLWIAGCMIAAAVFWMWSLWTLLMIAWSLWSAARQSGAAWRAADAARNDG